MVLLFPLSSSQVSGWVSPALVSSQGLSSKVTCHFSHMGLGGWAHLLVDSPWHDATWGALFRWLPVLNLHWQLPEHLWLPACQWPQLREQFSLFILSSSSTTAPSACQWASLNTARASSQNLTLYPSVNHSWFGCGCYISPGGHI